jgi:hypothetical protein
MISPHHPFTPYQAQSQQSLHVAWVTATTMAGKWRRLLEQESEHQWLSIAAFFIFVLVGAFAIGATEHFVGATVVDVEAAHDGGLVTEIAYGPDAGTYTALVYSPQNGYSLYTEDTQNGDLRVVYSPETVDNGAEVNFLKTMPDGEILFSVTNNQVIGLQGEQMAFYDYPTTNGEFGVLDVAEHMSGDIVHRLLLTQEGTNTSVRGVVAMTPTPAMSTSLGVQWHTIESYGSDLWIALGTHVSTAGADGSSPATPQARPVLGWIQWEGTNATPVVQKVQTFGEGVFHSVAKSGDAVVIGGTSQSLLIHAPNDVEVLEIATVHVIADTNERVWFIGPMGSTVLRTYHNGDLDTHVLGRPMPVESHSVGASGRFVHVHGTDESGAPIQWSIDTSANGSIESGRGFLNLLYLMTGTVILALMIRYAALEFKQQA